MKVVMFGFATLCACFFSMQSFAEETITDKSTGKSFPKEITFDADGKRYTLQASGVATRKKLIVKVYSIASYLQKGAMISNGDKIGAILSDDNAKQLTLKWVRDVNRSQIIGAFEESLHKVLTPQDYDQMKNSIAEFFQIFNQDAKNGEELVLRWVPGGDVIVINNGKKLGLVHNPAFAKALWMIWFGEKSIVDRNELMSLL